MIYEIFIKILRQNWQRFNFLGTNVCLPAKVIAKAGITIATCLVTVFIAFAQPPDADFTSDITSGCFPITVNFLDLSTNSPTSWFWDFDNGNTSVLQNPSAVYLAPDNYTVVLIACNGNGCDTIVINQYITVFDYPIADLTSNITYGCAPLTVEFTDLSTPTSSPIVSWFWDFGDGNSSMASNPVYTYQYPGIFDVSISITDSLGCNDSEAKTDYIVVSTPPALSFTMDSSSSCTSPLTVVFTNTSTPGTYPVKSWYWEFGDGFTDTTSSSEHIYNGDGSYTVSLTATDSIGCSVTLTDTNAVVIGKDTADFTFTTVRTCSELQVSFSGTSTGNISDWSWDFGDGSPPQSGQNVTYSYTVSGQFTVTLITTNTGSCTDTVSKNLSYLKVNAGFFPDTTYGCSLPFTVFFTDTSTGTQPLSWAWDFSYDPVFGFNLESNLQNPSYTYTYEDTFNVMLIVTDLFGCTESVTLKASGDSIWILELIADFIRVPYEGCAPLNVNFTDNSISDMGTIISWQWNFDDIASGANNFSSLQNPSHTFDTVGIYYVKLVITNNLGCSDSVIRTVRTGYPPMADSITKSKSIACHGEPVQFTAFSPDSNVNGGSWNWGDGYSGYGWPSTSHSFQDTGTLIITFTPIFNGCPGFPIYDTIYILPPKPIFTASSTFSCRIPFTVTFTNSSWEADSWSWNFGDGSPVDTTTWIPVHTYTSPGRHIVTLTVSNVSTGCTDSKSLLYIDIPQPTASFTASPTVGCVPLEVTFNNASFTYIPVYYPITSWWWDFGDGTFSNQKNPIHTYSDTASFTVTLVVTDNSGCKDTLVKPNYITTSATIADLNASSTVGCQPHTVNFTDQSIPYSPIVSWSWDFGDGSPANTTQNPTYVYTTSGNFDVLLSITDSIGCTNTMTKSSFIFISKPNAQFSLPTKVCLNQSYDFMNNTSGTGLSYLWNFGDEVTTSIENPSHIYSDTGLYTVTLIATDTNNCTDTAISQIEGIAPPIANFSVDSFFAICPPLIVQFTDLSTNVNDSIVSWEWDFGDSTSVTSPNPVHTFAYPDIFSIQLIVTNTTGCIDSLLIPDMITVAGPTGSFIFSPDTGCVPLTVTFTASVNNVEEFTWDFGDGVVDTLSDLAVMHTYTLTGYPNPQLYITDSMGCKLPATPPIPSFLTIDEVIADFSLFPLPLYTPFCPPDTVFFNDSSYSLNDSALITGWLWDFGDGTIDTAQNPMHVYTDTCTFIISLTANSSLGCSDTTTRTIKVILNDTLVLKAVIADSIPIYCYGSNNGEATAAGLSGTPPYTFMWGSSAGNQSTATATGLIPGTHSVTVTDSMGCTDSATVLINEPTELNVFTDSITDVSCFGFSDGSIAASATGGTLPYSYQWDTAAANQTTPLAINLIAGVYTLTVTDSNGCSSTLTDTVSEPDTLIIIISDTIPVACFGDSSGSAIVSSSGGTPPYTYVWNPSFAGNNDTALNLPALSYSVTVVDINGCDTSISFTITQPSELTLFITKSDVTCDGGNDGSATANPSGGIPPYSYNWNDASTQSTQTATDLPVGTWTVTVTDSNGCTITASETITAPPPLTLVMNKTDVSCYGGNNGTAIANPSGGIPSYTYAWNDSSTQTTATAIGLTAETWTVTVTDSNDCSIEDSITVSEPDSLVISFITNDVTCNGGNDGTATANTSGGTPPYAYSWNDTSAQTTLTANDLPAGTWTVTVTDTNGCTVADTVTITEPTAILLSMNASDVLCNGGNDGTATASPSEGSPPYTYLWNDSLAQTTQTAIDLTAGTWTVTVTDSNNCTTDTQVTVSEPPLLTANILEIRSVLCYGVSNGELAAQPSGGTYPYSYLWMPVNSTAPSIDSLPADNYILTVTDSHNCEASDTVAIIELTPLDVSVDDDGSDTVCYGVNHSLDAQPSGSAPPYTFLWTDGTNTFTGNPITVVPYTTQSWAVMVTDSAGCANTGSVTLFVNYLEVSLSYQGTVCYGTPTTIEAVANGTLPGYNSNYTYQWNTSQTTSSVQVQVFYSTTTFTVTVTDGCSKETSASATLDLYPSPDIGIKISSSPVCPLSEITFTDTINSIPGSQHFWDFKDGNTASGITVQHAYSSGGTYYPSVTVITPGGCSKTAISTVPVIIYAMPHADFVADPFVTEIIYPEINFTDISWIDPIMFDEIVNYLWDFGDGDTTGDINPTHIFQDTGTYQVTLTVTTQYGCQGQIILEIRIDPHIEFSIPNAFTPNPDGSSGGIYDPGSYDNDVFYPLTKYEKEYLFQIFNRWGELIFESTDLAIGWDGYYRGKLCQQDTYIWKLKIIWTTGLEYKDVGRVLLIR
ncbi:MAG: PKD domain-containing protein [Bacteroidota bacterium]